MQPLVIANKASFRNCLVAMRPAATKADIPSAHDVSTFIHNSFIDFFQRLKTNIQVSSILFWVAYSKPHTLQSNAAGRVSTTMDLWLVNQTKAAFLVSPHTGSRPTHPVNGHSTLKSSHSGASQVLTMGPTLAGILLDYVSALGSLQLQIGRAHV